MTIIGIDPSINNVGIAIYDTLTKQLQLETFHPIKRPLLQVSIQIARHVVLRFLQGKKEFALVIEYPEFQGSQRGTVAAMKGYTLDLAFIVGYLSASLAIPSSRIWLPTPKAWKGNLPKTAVGIRFTERYGLEYTNYSDHEYEAAMMIAWLMDLKVLPI